jgi:hypothetical protein
MVSCKCFFFLLLLLYRNDDDRIFSPEQDFVSLECSFGFYYAEPSFLPYPAVLFWVSFRVSCFALSIIIINISVHDDVQLAQWLRNNDGRIKLGDFNRAKFLTYDAKKEQYCRYDYGGRAWRVSKGMLCVCNNICAAVLL